MLPILSNHIFQWYFIHQNPTWQPSICYTVQLYCEKAHSLKTGLAPWKEQAGGGECCHLSGQEAQISRVWETVNTGVMTNIYPNCLGLYLGFTSFNFKLPKVWFLDHVPCSVSLCRNSHRAVQLRQLRLPGRDSKETQTDAFGCCFIALMCGKVQFSSISPFSHALLFLRGTLWCYPLSEALCSLDTSLWQFYSFDELFICWICELNWLKEGPVRSHKVSSSNW